MPYVRRQPDGQIRSLHRDAEDGAQEFLGDQHPDVQAFVGRDAFAQLDADFVRVLEDLIDALVSRRVLNITDLPAEAQTKLFSRKGFRERRLGNSLQLFGDLASDDSGDHGLVPDPLGRGGDTPPR